MKLALKKGATDQSVLIFIQDSASTTGGGKTGIAYNASGLVCYYARPGAAAAQLTLATQTVTGAHSDGGFVEIDATNMPGVYRLDLSDAIIATGVNSAVIMLKGASGMAPLPIEIQLTDFDLNTATPKVDLDTIKTQAITCAAGVTVLANLGFAGAPGANNGAPTTNGTKINQTADLTAGQSIACSDKTGFALSATGADLIVKSSTFVQAIVAAINEFATYGLTALNTLLVTTGIKAASIPAVTLADDAITAAKFDESTAFPLKSADTGATAVARTGADSDTLETLSDEIAAVSAPSAGDVADAVWDEVLDTAHEVAGSASVLLQAAGGAADPLLNAVPGSYGAGTAGRVLGDYLNSSIAALRSVVDNIHDTDLPAVKTVVDTIQADTDLLDDAAGGIADIHTDIGTLQTMLTDIHDTDLPAVKTVLDNIHDTDLPAVKTVVDTIQADTDLLDDVSGGLADIHTDIAALKTILDNIHDTDLPAVKTVVDTIQADTDLLDDVSGGLADIHTDIAAIKLVVDLIEDIVRNQLEITDANGNVVLRADNSSDVLYSVAGGITDNLTTTIRKKLA